MLSVAHRIPYTTYINGRQRNRWREIVGETDVGSDRMAAPADPEATLHSREVIAGLAKLPDDQRAAILLIALEGLSYDEAATVLNVPIGAVRSRLWRGREARRRRGCANSSPRAP